MPLTLNIGLSKKIGLPDYGSLGASCHVEIELDGHLIQHDLDTFHKHVRQAYAACRQAVQEELSRREIADAHASGNNGQSNENSHTRRRDNPRPATASQARAIEAIAQRQQLDLGAMLRERYGVRTAADLSITEASALIDELKTTGNGRTKGAAA